MKPSIRAIFDELYTRYPALISCAADIEGAAAMMIDSFRNGGKLLTCGGIYIWWLVDLFYIMDATKEKNFAKFNSALYI